MCEGSREPITTPAVQTVKPVWVGRGAHQKFRNLHQSLQALQLGQDQPQIRDDHPVAGGRSA